ncbi:MAG: sortase [Omnitrophica WOR_2 bacterium]
MSIRPNPSQVLEQSHKVSIRRFLPLIPFILILVWMAGNPWIIPTFAQGTPGLTITPITWNIIGLDRTDLSAGPNTFPVGVRVCNPTSVPVTNLIVQFVWQNDNNNIILSVADIQELGSLDAAKCQSFYFDVFINRDASVIGTSRRYAITVKADHVDLLSTPTPREIFVEDLRPTTALKTLKLSGPQLVQPGKTYQYVLQASISSGFQEYENFINFPGDQVKILKVTSQNTIPPYDLLYVDRCSWQNDPITTTYKTCADPNNSISGTLITTYTVEIQSEGAFSLTGMLYGFSIINQTGEYLYNSDYGQNTLQVTALSPTPTNPNTTTPTVTRTPTRTLTPAVTATPTATSTSKTTTPSATGPTPTPTRTGTITPNPGATKSVQPTAAQIGGKLTFTIRLTNKGSAPAKNMVVTDSFASYTYLDIYDLTTTKGTRNINGRIASANIGSLLPGEIVEVKIVIRVNSTAFSTTTPCNQADISFTGGTRHSNQVCFTVTGGSTLPPTGELPLETGNSSVVFIVLFSAALLVVLFGIVLFIRSRLRPGTARVSLSSLLSVTVLIVLVLLIGILVNGKILSKTPESQGSANIHNEPMMAELALSPSPTVDPLAILPAYMFATPLAMEEPIETLPSYPVPTPSVIPTGKPGAGSPDMTSVNRIAIPALQLDAVVAYVPFDGQTWKIQGLRQEVAWLGNTSWPGLGGNTGLAGHVTVRGMGNGPFRYLTNLTPGDEVRLYTDQKIYTYRVSEISTVEETDLAVLQPSEKPQITLITCVEWNENIGIYLKRLVVKADLVKADPLQRLSGD